MLRTEKLNAGYRELHILFDVDAKVNEKEITCVVGPNGSGKSTLLKAIFGLATIHSGKVVFKNEDITDVPPHEKTKMGIAYLPQTDNVFTNLTVEENLKIAGYTLEKDELKDRVDLALDVFPELKYQLKRKAGTLSGGERQFLAIATALVRKAELLMLDEPTAQLSPKFAEIIFQKILELRDKLGLTILLVEQNVKASLEIGDKGILVVNGRIAFDGPAGELLRSKDLARMYLGL